MPTRILVVDDIESNLIALEALLEGPGVEVVRAGSGPEAIAALRQGEFSLIVLDVQMPEMDGFDTAAVIRRRETKRRTPIIFVTAHGGTREKLARAYATGAAEFMTKPIDPDALRAKVSVIVELWRMMDESRRESDVQHEQRLTSERQQWETQALRALVAEQERATIAEHAARLAAEKANNLKDEFLATLSHELRSPLNAVLGWAAILKERCADQPHLKKGLDAIERNAKAQSVLIEDVLDTSRIVAGKLRLDCQSVVLPDIIDRALEAIHPAAARKHLDIKVDVDRSVPAIVGDPERLRQVFINLLSNAVKFSVDSGSMIVELRHDASRVCVTLTDTGIGIAPEFLPYVFDRFRQADGGISRSHGGLGIGLALARHLVELHGGAIEAASDGKGTGATFKIVLPIGAAETAVQTTADRNTPARGTALLTNLRVLFADDDPDACDLAREIFEAAGVTIMTVGSAAEAVEALSSWRPDVLVSDIGMAANDGYALMQQIRALPAAAGGDIPAIALTAYASADDMARAHAAGFQAHLTKPVEPARLLSTVAGVAAIRRQERS